MTGALIVVVHPDLRSLSHQVAAEVGDALTDAGVSSEVADLAAERFDPRFNAGDRSAYRRGAAVLGDVAAEQKRLDRVEHLILVFPVYWWSMPALLKGWIDRVFVNGWAFEQPEGGSLTPKLQRLTIHLVPIAGGDADGYQRHGYGTSLSTQIEHGIVDFCGARRGSTRYLYDSETKTATVLAEEAKQLAHDIAQEITAANGVPL
ncbi:NAD(P)H-dependent oxidoreductase [Arthrobacter zhaoguopingii]|uniref:NAD(P)H-dependent oxidoreductase n=1 Tax=Arthrobacter zhaoguopingii TaxID=2681491 RepID=UPI001357DCF0|nr:NAD(P)H-dependent oxidoreductase [Arthrobacter zhaoguopingii]